MVRQIFFLIFCVLLSNVPVTRASDADSFEVRSRFTLSTSNSPYIFQSITVFEDGELIIEPGVTILLKPGGSVNIAGTLRSNGTSQHRIEFSSSEEDWSGFHAQKIATVELSFTNFAHFTLPVLLQTDRLSLSNLTFTDGLENVVRVESSAALSFTATNLTFSNKLRGTTMGNEGVYLVGSFADIHFKNILINDLRAREESSFLIGLKVEGEYFNFQGLNITFIGICPPTFRKVVPRKLVEVVSGSTQCDWNKVPTVFVPGYGTSVNLKRLSKAALDGPQLEGWRFLNFFTPAYTSFLQTLKANQVPYSVAYYDWRLPAQAIVEEYLQPVIESIKKKTGVPIVNLVAHSFGGIVSRTYIQRKMYQGDVANLVELGVPNQGAAKAYPIWENGEVPADWQSFLYLIRLYTYQEKSKKLTIQEVIHKYFPSVKELLPTYPAIFFRGEVQDPRKFTYQNTLSLQLEDSLNLLEERTRTTSVFSTDQETVETFNTTRHSGGSSVSWPDGPLSVLQNPLQQVGDGTVPAQSAILPHASRMLVDGNHADLPKTAQKNVLQLLYPLKKYISAQQAAQKNSFHWFVFDCPVEVIITMPDGTWRSSEEMDSDQVDQVGEVENSDNMLWMLLPKEVGAYQVRVRAKESTEVRGWLDGGAIQTTFLEKGQEVSWNFDKQVSPNTPPVQSAPRQAELKENITFSSFSLTFQPAQLSFRDLPHPISARLPVAPISATVFPQHPRVSKTVSSQHVRLGKIAVICTVFLLMAALILLMRRRE